MKGIVLAALAALVLVCPLPADAQTQSVMYSGAGNTVQQNTLTTGSTDRVYTTLSGSAWATATFKVVSAGTATGTAQTSADGVNWLPAPYAKKLSAVSANPTVQAISNTTLSTGDVWEVPLPANTLYFGILCGTTGTTTTVSVQGGAPYVPGNGVAVLYDVTSGTNAALDTSTIDLNGWSVVQHDFSMNGGTPAFSMAEVDDGGTTLGNLVTGTAAFTGGMGAGTTIGGTAGLVAATASVPLVKRARYQSAAIVSQTSRIRIVARR